LAKLFFVYYSFIFNALITTVIWFQIHSINISLLNCTVRIRKVMELLVLFRND